MLIPDEHRNYISFVSTYSHRNPSVRLFSVELHFSSCSPTTGSKIPKLFHRLVTTNNPANARL